MERVKGIILHLVGYKGKPDRTGTSPDGEGSGTNGRGTGNGPSLGPGVSGGYRWI